MLITGDKNMRYQQNLAERRVSIVTLGSRLITMRHIAPLAPAVLRALDDLPLGAFVTIEEEDQGNTSGGVCPTIGDGLDEE